MNNITDRNVAIAEALGLDPTKICRGGVRITLDSDLGPVVEVKYRTMDEHMANNFVGALVRYRLVEIEDAEDAVSPPG